MVLGSGSLLSEPCFSFLISQHRAKSSLSNCTLPTSPRFSRQSQHHSSVARCTVFFFNDLTTSTLHDYHQIGTSRGKKQRRWSQTFLRGHQQKQITSFGHSMALHAACNTTGAEGQRSHLHTALLHRRSRRGVALGHVSPMMQRSALDFTSEHTGRHTHGDHFPFTPCWVSGCIHLASDHWLQQHFCMEEASWNPISAATEEILKLWPVLLPLPPKFSSFSAKYWWHCSGLESQMQPELRKHYKSICSNIYSEIFHATPTTDFSLLRTWCTGEGQTTRSIYCCQAKYH